MTPDHEHLITANKENLARVIGFVSVIDAKAQFVLALVLALTSYLIVQLGPYLDAHRRWATLPPNTGVFFVLLDLVALACGVLFFFSAAQVIKTIHPRTGRHTGKSSPLFYATIAQMSHEDFKATMRTLPTNEFVDLLIDQTYDNAKIVATKTETVKASVKFFVAGALCFFTFTIARTLLVSFTTK
jgi:hypothetical protein